MAVVSEESSSLLRRGVPRVLALICAPLVLLPVATGTAYAAAVSPGAPLQDGLMPNPFGCRGQTDLPHESSTSGEASTHSRTRCMLVAPRVSVTNAMYRGRFYGAEFLASGSSFRDVSNDSKDAVARWHCAGVGIYTYETDS